MENQPIPQPPLQQPLRQAEHAISRIVTAPGSQWGITAKHEWAVGVNAAHSPQAQDRPDVLVSQALGPKPAEQLARYTADTPWGKMHWTEDAQDLSDIKREDGQPWGSVQLAQRALGSVISAQVIEQPNTKKPS